MKSPPRVSINFPSRTSIFVILRAAAESLISVNMSRFSTAAGSGP